ncbi:hypothetical protein SVIOM342S_00816 [Streptomyces violaceorubidus]
MRQAQEVHQRAGVAGRVHRRVQADGKHRAGHLAGDAGGEHLLVRRVGLAVILHRATDQLVLLGGALDEDVLAGAALLHQLAGGVRHVEDRLELTVAARLLVVGPADAVPHELPEDEDRGADEAGRSESRSKGAAVPVPHEVVDQALGAPPGHFFSSIQGLLPGGRDPGGEQHVGVGRQGASSTSSTVMSPRRSILKSSAGVSVAVCGGPYAIWSLGGAASTAAGPRPAESGDRCRAAMKSAQQGTRRGVRSSV